MVIEMKQSHKKQRQQTSKKTNTKVDMTRWELCQKLNLTTLKNSIGTIQNLSKEIFVWLVVLMAYQPSWVI